MGLQNQPFLAAGWFQAQISYQYGRSDSLYYGDQRVDSMGPGGQPPIRKVNIWDLDVLYGVSNRLSLDLTVPILSGNGGFYAPNRSGQFFAFNASGVGDVSLTGEYWLNDPTGPSKISGSISLGIKAPTGSDTVLGTYPNGVETPIDEAFQLGNGGWEMLVRAQGQAPFGKAFAAYGSAYYGVSLKETTGVTQVGASGAVLGLRGVPDTYSGRLGVGYLVPFLEGLALSVGGRINGVTVKDLVGGGDLYWRRPGYEVYVEPGVAWTMGRNTASFSFPVGVYRNKLDSLLDLSLNPPRKIPAGFVPYLIVASFGHRF